MRVIYRESGDRGIVLTVSNSGTSCDVRFDDYEEKEVKTENLRPAFSATEHLLSAESLWRGTFLSTSS